MRVPTEGVRDKVCRFSICNGTFLAGEAIFRAMG